MPNTKNTTEETPEVTTEETPEEIMEIGAEEALDFNTHFGAVVALEKAIETHNTSGLQLIKAFGETRRKMLDAGVPKKDTAKRVYDSSIILFGAYKDIQVIDGEKVEIPLSDRAVGRVRKELLSIMHFFQSGLQIRHSALPFTTFAKLVALYIENDKTMTKSAIKSAYDRSYPKADKIDLLTTSQLADCDKNYVAKIKTLITKVEAMNLAGDYKPEDVTPEFAALVSSLQTGTTKDQIKNMINGLKMALNASEGVFTPKKSA